MYESEEPARPDTARPEKKGAGRSAGRKIALACVFCAAAAAAVFLCLRGLSSSSARERRNTLALVRMYMEKGEYDRAMDKLDELLIRNPEDAEARALMDGVIAAKEKGAAGQGGGQDSSVRLEVDTQGLTDAMQSSLESMRNELARTSEAAEKNRAAMTDLLKKQQEQTELENARKEDQRRQQKAAEEQRKKEEAERRAAEEELSRRNAQLKKEIAAVNDSVEQGRTALNSGRIDEALRHFADAEKSLPVSDGEPAFSGGKYSEMAALLYDAANKAAVGADRDRLNSAAAVYARTAVEKNPKEPAAHYILGMDALSRREYDAALDELSEAVSLDNSNGVYYYDLGRAQYMTKKYTEAKAAFVTAVRLDPDSATACYNLALTSLKLNDRKTALANLRRARDIDPQYERAWLEEARLLSRTGDLSGAVSAYENVVRINSVNRAAQQELGSVYYQAGRPADAESAFRKSLALLPAGQEDPLTCYNLSTVLYEQGRADEAVEYARRAYDSRALVRSDASRADIVYNYALVCEKTGDADTAVGKYAEALQIAPGHLRALINLGVMYMNMTPPDADTALSLFRKAYEQDGNNFEANNNLGSAYLEKKDYENAVLYFQNALKLDARNNMVRRNLAQAFAGAGQYDNAKTTYLEAVRLNNEEWDAYVELGKVCLALHDGDSAEKYLLYVQAKNPSWRKSEVEALLASVSASGAK